MQNTQSPQLKLTTNKETNTSSFVNEFSSFIKQSNAESGILCYTIHRHVEQFLTVNTGLRNNVNSLCFQQNEVYEPLIWDNCHYKFPPTVNVTGTERESTIAAAAFFFRNKFEVY